VLAGEGFNIDALQFSFPAERGNIGELPMFCSGKPARRPIHKDVVSTR